MRKKNVNFTRLWQRKLKKLLNFIIEQNNSNAFRNIAPIAITKKNVDELIEKAQTNKNIELLKILLEFLK